MTTDVVLIEGDGIGPEIASVAKSVIDAVGLDITWHQRPAGFGAWEKYGHTAPAETLDAIRKYGSALKGPFNTPSGTQIRSANLYIRRELDLYACLRPIVDVRRGVDILLVRENVEDHYAAIEWQPAPGVAQAVKLATESGCRRVAQFASDLAIARQRRSVCVVHKANNLKLTEGMFLDVSREVLANSGVTTTDMLADTACSTMVLDPQSFDIILTSNTFGDLLSNVGAAVVGGLGLVASLNVGEGIVVAEASHGSSDDLRGTGRANPLAMISAAAMLVDRLGFADEAVRLERAIEAVRSGDVLTPDLGGTATTSQVGEMVIHQLQAS